jgi:hypothetical protein
VKELMVIGVCGEKACGEASWNRENKIFQNYDSYKMGKTFNKIFAI